MHLKEFTFYSTVNGLINLKNKVQALDYFRVESRSVQAVRKSKNSKNDNAIRFRVITRLRSKTEQRLQRRPRWKYHSQ